MDKKIHEGTMKVGLIHGDEDGANPVENSSFILGSPTGSGWAALVLYFGALTIAYLFSALISFMR